MRSFAAGIACLVLVATAEAQFPIGHATPVGGFTPSLFSDPPWYGNSGFGFRITGAPPAANAFVALSGQRQDQMIGGLQIYVDVAGIVSTYGTTMDATGQAFIHLPLPGPEVPAFAGLRAYAQAAVEDPSSPGSLGTTQGLLLEVTLNPLFAISHPGSLHLVDVLTSATTTVPGPFSNTVVAFGNGGRDLFVATNSGVFVVDTLLAPSTPVPLASGPSVTGSLAWDRVHRRLYVQSPGTLSVIDGDASGAFGAIITQTSSPSTYVDVSADGSMIALLAPTGAVERRIGDPASPAYLTSIPMPQPQVTLDGFSVVGPVHISPDGRVISFPIDTIGGFQIDVVHRFDVVTNQWIDHNPTAAGTQPLSNSFATPGIPQQFGRYLPSRDGSSLVFPGTVSAMARVDLDLADPTHVSVVTLPVPGGGFGSDYPALTPSGRFVVRRNFNPFNSVGPVALSLVELATGTVTPWATITPANTQFPRGVWR
jgi:hypothetical protein